MTSGQKTNLHVIDLQTPKESVLTLSALQLHLTPAILWTPPGFPPLSFESWCSLPDALLLALFPPSAFSPSLGVHTESHLLGGASVSPFAQGIRASCSVPSSISLASCSSTYYRTCLHGVRHLPLIKQQGPWGIPCCSGVTGSLNRGWSKSLAP